MDKNLIVLRSMGALRKAAAEGQAYYSCERFEDKYGRLVVGIGARLEGRILRTVASLGRQAVHASPVALYDGKRFQNMLDETPDANKRDGVQEMYAAFAQRHPQAAKKIAVLNPQDEDLKHGVCVGQYVRQLMQAYNRIQRHGAYQFSPKDMMSGFVAGVVHDIGCWRGLSLDGHATRGAEFLRRLVVDSKWIHTLANWVAQHHMPVSLCRDEQMLKVLPLILAECMIESGPQVVYALVAEYTTDSAKDMLICLCNLENIIPPLSVVRLRERAGGLKSELAVCLRCAQNRDFSPYLLRFAHVDVRGRPRPMPLEHQCLIGRGHPDYEGRERVVVDLLSERDYVRLFKDYEGLITVYQRILSKEQISF